MSAVHSVDTTTLMKTSETGTTATSNRNNHFNWEHLAGKVLKTWPLMSAQYTHYALREKGIVLE